MNESSSFAMLLEINIHVISPNDCELFFERSVAQFRDAAEALLLSTP